MKMIRLLAILITLNIFVSCGPSEAEHSNVNFARDSRVDGSLLYVLDHLASGNLVSEPKICLDLGTRNTISQPEMELLVRASIYTWLLSADYQNIDVIDQLQFSFACSKDESKKSILNIVNRAATDENEETVRIERFGVPKATCEYNLGVRCSSTGVTLAYASQVPGYKFAEKYFVAKAAPLHFNPNLNWVGLGEDLLKLGQIELKAELERILESKDFSILNISNFIQSLSLAKLIAPAPSELSEIMMQSMNLKKSVDKSYTPTYGIYSTLLHEMGHVMGLNHADNPSFNTITGRVTDNDLGEGKVFTTKESIMAYGDSYLYLEEDDVNGIKSVKRALKIGGEN